jgi:tRNA uridine 5-carboxymethylaminomethyl modification enzyme
MDHEAIVVGAGHAGIEAALALARVGLDTLLVTQSLDAVGRMSCNPAIGGLAKGNLVREVDALGGEMGRLADATMIQFRMLNASRGPAVQAPRAQADKQAYAALAKRTLEQQPHLALMQDTVVDLVLDDAGRRIEGVKTERGRSIGARVVVLTTGTFMEARLFIGEWTGPGGRLGEPPAAGLGSALRRIGFEVGRLKTGTPARVLGRSLVRERMEEQRADPEVVPFSFATDRVDRPSVPCWITHTNAETHRIIRESLDRSPLFAGRIVGRGPRYCPSIETKVVRFPDRTRHQVFVEPEGLGTDEMYLNGVSTSLPEDVQDRFLRTIVGLEHVEIVRPGYAVEYDYLPPTQLTPALMTKRIEGLFVAGQTNGTSGYEEAAAQGIVAGINAARWARGAEPLVLSRSEAYIGVLIDDLVTLGADEPYRMFTSRAEHRLSLRHDTADLRLVPYGHAAGLQPDAALERLERKRRGIEEVRELLRRRRVNGDDAAAVSDLAAHRGETFEQALRNPQLALEVLARLEPSLAALERSWRGLAELEVKYEGYVRHQEEQVGRARAMEALHIPPDFDWESTSGLSSEAREKLAVIRPLSVGQASRVPGVRQGDLAVLLVLLGKGRRRAPPEGRRRAPPEGRRRAPPEERP